MADLTPAASGEERPASLPDVAGVPLAALFASEDTVLAVAIRRVVGGVDAAAQAISGWSSFVDNTCPDEEETDG